MFAFRNDTEQISMATASDDREKVNHPTEPGRLRFWWVGVWVEGVRLVFRSWVVPFGVVGFRGLRCCCLVGGIRIGMSVLWASSTTWTSSIMGLPPVQVPLAGTVAGISYNFTFTGIPTSVGMPPGSRPPCSSTVGSP